MEFMPGMVEHEKGLYLLSLSPFVWCHFVGAVNALI